MEERYAEQAGKQLEAEYRLLESLEGYKALTERQQNIIRGSLLVQKWSDIGKQSPEADVETYKSAFRYASVMFCYAAAAALERGEDLTLDDLTDVPSEFYMAEYAKVADFSALDHMVSGTGFPCVVLTASGDPMTIPLEEGSPRDAMHHACIALGRDASGDIIVWEKEGGRSDWPFQLHALKTVYRDYENDRTHWATRTLRELKD